VPTTSLADEFRRAVDHVFRHSPSRHRVRIGPFCVELAFHDDAVASEFLAAFPADVTGRVPDFSIAVACGPDAALEPLIPRARAESFSLTEDGCYALWLPDPGEALHIHDLASRRGFSWLPTSQAIESFRSRPVLPPIHAQVAAGPWAPVHAGAVGRHGKVLLLAGPGGSGKSTATVACAAAGWTYAGDDYVLVSPENRLVEPIYASARLRPEAIDPMRDFIAASQVAVSHDFGDPRHELRLGHTSATIAGGDLAAILLPRRTGAAEPTFRRAGPAETFYAVVTVTLAQLPGMHDRLKPKLMALVRSVPSFVVDTGPDPRAVPSAFAAFLDGL
jgi:hypothetical protein